MQAVALQQQLDLFGRREPGTEEQRQRSMGIFGRRLRCSDHPDLSVGIVDNAAGGDHRRRVVGIGERVIEEDDRPDSCWLGAEPPQVAAGPNGGGGHCAGCLLAGCSRAIADLHVAASGDRLEPSPASRHDGTPRPANGLPPIGLHMSATSLGAWGRPPRRLPVV